MPFDARMTQRSSSWYGTARALLSCSDAQLRERLAGVAAAVGVSQQRASAVVLARPQLLLPSVTMEQLRSRLQPLRQWLSAEQLATLLMEQGPWAMLHEFWASQWHSELLAAALHLWMDLVGLPADTALASIEETVNHAWPLLLFVGQDDTPLLRYVDSTIQRRVAAIRQVRLRSLRGRSLSIYSLPEARFPINPLTCARRRA